MTLALSACLIGAMWVAIACAGSPLVEESAPTPKALHAGPDSAASEDALGPYALAPAPPIEDGTYLAPNVEDIDGTPGFLHVTEADMPLVVAIGYPPAPPRDGSRADARRVAIEAMQQWEQAISPRLTWFRLQFVEEDRSAAVQIVWKRKILGPWGGFGGLRWESGPGALRVGGMMQVSTTPGGTIDVYRLELDELRLVIAHEFGHVLGLGHCLDCDSAMNYAWTSSGRVLVTDADVRTFLALIAQPSGVRVDGQPLRFLETSR